MSGSAHRATFVTYQSAWLLGLTTAERLARLRQSVVENCVYQDPGVTCHGYPELLAKIDDANQKGPGARFRNDRFLEHHDKAIVNWTMFDGAGDDYAQGASYVEFAADGRLARMTGFYDAPDRPFKAADDGPK